MKLNFQRYELIWKELEEVYVQDIMKYAFQVPHSPQSVVFVAGEISVLEFPTTFTFSV